MSWIDWVLSKDMGKKIGRSTEKIKKVTAEIHKVVGAESPEEKKIPWYFRSFNLLFVLIAIVVIGYTLIQLLRVLT